jgi:hypothetical protein
MDEAARRHSRPGGFVQSDELFCRHESSFIALRRETTSYYEGAGPLLIV